MTSREVYDNLLSELNKEEAPTLLLETFNYFFGKAINETCNQWYGLYEETQLITDNLRVLTKSAPLTNANISGGNFYQLPSDYWHLLPTVLVTFARTDGGDPCNTGSSPTFVKPARKLDSQINSGIINDYYTKPSYKKPYVYLHQHTSGNNIYQLEIKSGDTSVYKPTTITIDYLKMPELPRYVGTHAEKSTDPKNLYLTRDELESDTDISTVLEFPNNFCYEIINKLTALVLEHNGDPRIQINPQINQSMLPPKQG